MFEEEQNKINDNNQEIQNEDKNKENMQQLIKEDSIEIVKIKII